MGFHGCKVVYNVKVVYNAAKSCTLRVQLMMSWNTLTRNALKSFICTIAQLIAEKRVCYVDLSHPPVGATILIVCVLYCQNNYDDLYIV
jgi:hypothetical protein